MAKIIKVKDGDMEFIFTENELDMNRPIHEITDEFLATGKLGVFDFTKTKNMLVMEFNKELRKQCPSVNHNFEEE